MEYADVVWDNCSQYEVNDLEKIQNEAVRIVSGATKLVSINSLSLETAGVVWDNCSQYEVNDLEKIQNEAVRMVSGATKLVSINSLSLETGWESLSSRRIQYLISTRCLLVIS